MPSEAETNLILWACIASPVLIAAGVGLLRAGYWLLHRRDA